METAPEQQSPQPADANANKQPVIDLEALAELVFEMMRRELRLESDRTGK